jgi:hypothetical protein
MTERQTEILEEITDKYGAAYAAEFYPCDKDGRNPKGQWLWTSQDLRNDEERRTFLKSIGFKFVRGYNPKGNWANNCGKPAKFKRKGKAAAITRDKELEALEI